MTAHAFDHIAIAVPDWARAGPWLADALGGRWGHGARMPHMDVCQIHFGNDTRIELLAPGSAPDSFVRRFLAQGGGRHRPHHLTFKVDDIERTLAEAGARGIGPILVNLAHDVWREAFLHPRDTGLGFLVQFVQSSLDPATLESDVRVPAPWPDRAHGDAADIEFVLARVPSLDVPRTVLGDVLGGKAEEFRTPGGEPGVCFSWAHGARVVVVGSGDPGEAAGVRSIGLGSSPELDIPAAPVGHGLADTGLLDVLGVSLLVPV
ncbi:VOC family protein [Actinocorallia sp. A-T 12471]|uniref:VOC family protein n=1 Tax=Actinocorallia sp. A-T 12471 TaxID=3089813 RepID=UPI0029CCAF89|nr:VOC family protein [Actinocorallia sp. A-T 12471]MDX6740738.1 VOC family protein [Actinocorallia sp. A-T 12471]